MQIRVKSLQGDEYIVAVHDNQLVAQLKASISEKANGLPVERLKLVYKGRTMQDTSPISEYHLEEDCKVHLILQKDHKVEQATCPPPLSASSPTCAMDTTMPFASASNSLHGTQQQTDGSLSSDNQSQDQQLQQANQSRFVILLRERLSKHFPPSSVDKIIANLQNEINADINSSSLDDLERLAKQKLNMSNE